MPRLRLMIDVDSGLRSRFCLLRRCQPEDARSRIDNANSDELYRGASPFKAGHLPGAVQHRGAGRSQILYTPLNIIPETAALGNSQQFEAISSHAVEWTLASDDVDAEHSASIISRCPRTFPRAIARLPPYHRICREPSRPGTYSPRLRRLAPQLMPPCRAIPQATAVRQARSHTWSRATLGDF